MSQQLDLPALLAHPANGGLKPVATTPPAGATSDTVATPWRDVVVDSSESRLPADGNDSLAILTVGPPPDLVAAGRADPAGARPRLPGARVAERRRLHRRQPHPRRASRTDPAPHRRPDGARQGVLAAP